MDKYEYKQHVQELEMQYDAKCKNIENSKKSELEELKSIDKKMDKMIDILEELKESLNTNNSILKAIALKGGK
jgi:flagellin-specific chaperone FliS